ncbi:CBS domain-containing protein [Kitasatospora sp. NPDC058965]|uniref:CBS domain-containing protein n=1 Tax=Kitasatospora sp. NPDC058965 TaxID=3346682 RepID=UPI00367708C6
MPLTAAKVLAAKPNGGRTVYTIGKESPVLDAIRLMAEKGVGALVVLADQRIAGIVSERDYARKVELLGRTAGETRVEEIMTTAVRYVEPEQTVDECMALMTEHRMRHLPVLDGGTLSGLISIGDLVKSQIADQQFTISQLEHYIQGTPPTLGRL